MRTLVIILSSSALLVSSAVHAGSAFISPGKFVALPVDFARTPVRQAIQSCRPPGPAVKAQPSNDLRRFANSLVRLKPGIATGTGVVPITEAVGIQVYGMGKLPTKSPGVDLDCVLNRIPKLSSAIIWQTDTVLLPWRDWSKRQKSELKDAFARIWEWHQEGRPDVDPLRLPDPPENIALPYATPTSGVDLTILSEDDAWRTYVGYVANSLVVELQELVPWSLLSYNSSMLAYFLDSRSFFYPRKTPVRGYGINMDLAGFATPSSPAVEFGFLARGGMIGSTRLSTIGALLEWSRSTLVHFPGAYEISNMLRIWEYGGVPPVSRVIGGYLRTDIPKPAVYHTTAGCHGTAGVFSFVLKAVNIPAREVRACGHALVGFPSERMYLSHGDDPYNAFSYAPFPAQDLLIDEAKKKSWFDGDPTCRNVGRRPVEVGWNHLPKELVKEHCRDLRFSRSHAESWVYKDLKILEQPVSYFEERRLWERLDAKVSLLGGCEAVMGM